MPVVNVLALHEDVCTRMGFIVGSIATQRCLRRICYTCTLRYKDELHNLVRGSMSCRSLLLNRYHVVRYGGLACLYQPHPRFPAAWLLFMLRVENRHEKFLFCLSKSNRFCSMITLH